MKLPYHYLEENDVYLDNCMQKVYFIAKQTSRYEERHIVIGEDRFHRLGGKRKRAGRLFYFYNQHEAIYNTQKPYQKKHHEIISPRYIKNLQYVEKVLSHQQFITEKTIYPGSFSRSNHKFEIIIGNGNHYKNYRYDPVYRSGYEQTRHYQNAINLCRWLLTRYLPRELWLRDCYHSEWLGQQGAKICQAKRKEAYWKQLGSGEGL